MGYRGIALSILVALSLLTTGCSSDDYTFFDFDEEDTEQHFVGDIASLLVAPVRREYLLEGDAFIKTEEHLRVFAVYGNGNTQKIDLQETAVTVEDRVLTEEPHAFASSGEKTVTVSYAAQTAEYIIIVRSSTEYPGGTPEPSPGDGTSITVDIQWQKR